MNSGDLVISAQWNNGLLVSILLASTFIWFIFAAITYTRPSLPVFNDRKTFELSWNKAKERFRSGARGILFNAISNSPDACYVATDVGVEIVLGSKFAPEIGNDNRFNTWSLVQKKYFGDLPGFEIFSSDAHAVGVFGDVIKTKLTRSLDHTIEPIVEETLHVLETLWTDNPDWHNIDLFKTVLQLTAQQTSRIFLGKELCRDSEWLRITQSYVTSLFETAELLRSWPRFLCHFVAWLSPACRKLRTDIQEARELMNPVIEARKAKWKAKGGPSPATSSDAIDWFEEVSQGRPYDPVVGQLRLAVSSLHTTTDLLVQTLCDLCKQPELVENLREEIRENLDSDAKGAARLFKLKLLDSVLKESQRMKPATFTIISRDAMDKVKLSNGLVVKKGQTVNITAHGMWDDAVWPNASQYDGYRYFRMREAPGKATSHQLVSLHPDHLGFGYGRDACPGRFFAATELKISLCHILMRYDFKFAEGHDAKIDWHGVHLSPNNVVKLSIRRRQGRDGGDLQMFR